MKKAKKTAAPKYVHKLGDKHFIEGIECVVRHVNQGIGFLFPTTDDSDTPLTARHICFAKVYDDGRIQLL